MQYAGPKHATSLAAAGGNQRGFTLVEILIVVVIIGILAAVVVPQFSNATYQARENTLKDDLRYLRTQITVYKAQHRDVSPGSGGASFMDQMTLYTDEGGNTNASKTSTYKFGPYLARMPSNPLAQSEKSAVKISSASDLTSEIDDTDPSGWIYNPATLQIIANQSGSDTNGTLYSTY
jgi:general secretion pathway protein G